MIIETFALKSPAKHKTEDAFSLNRERNVYAVFDGVTPLASISPASTEERLELLAATEQDNDARRASQLFKAHFDRTDVSEDMVHELNEANTHLRQTMEAAGVDLRQRHLLWSTCAAAVHVGEQHVHYAHVGDCMIVALTQTDEIKVLTRDQVSGITERAKLHREAARNKGIYVPEEHYFEQALHRQAYNRWLANTSAGYGVANGRPEMKDFIQSGRILRADLKALLLISDGLFWPDRDLAYVTRTIETIGLTAYGDQLATYEEKHELYADDKTGIWVQFT